MATRKKKSTQGHQQYAVDTAYLNSDSGPALAPDTSATHPSLKQARAVGDMASAMPSNVMKPAEYGEQSRRPVTGTTIECPAQFASASTLTEANLSPKNDHQAGVGCSAESGELSRVKVDSTGRGMTTNQGVPIADNQSSLKAGLRGPVLLKDFILREKITHFDHERIPERIVHARGSAAHGYFECYESLSDLTCATLFAAAGKRTPVFVRFSTVAGERGSKDTARDVRGFAVKFYTEQGNWDLVGNNIPVFFIQDAMKFPDLVHAVKPEPHHGMPQAASAHDTFWDFISLMPESIHTIMWVMSDRGIPRSYRMMQGFGVHTFRFVTADGASKFVKFHWNPKQGTHSHVWDEAVKISGADPDFHRRDLWEAIEAGEYPEWELGVQIFDEQQAEAFSFDVLDATKLIPEELIPVTPIGRLVLNRNPDNFFAETEQVAFCTAHVIPGIDFTNDPLLAGRIHSYVDTQLSRLGGPNFHELPINAPLSPVHNNQRDGMHRQAIHRGRVAYEPNSLAGGCPFQNGQMGYMPFPEPIAADELRGKPEKFAEHYHQATLFYESQAEHEKQHIAEAFAFELSKLTVPGIRQRVVALLRNVSDELANVVATNLGMPELPAPLPRATETAVKPEISVSKYLSLLARPGECGIRSRKIAIMVSEGVDISALAPTVNGLIKKGAVVRLVGQHVGLITASDAQTIDADASFKNSPSSLFDAVIIPDGKKAAEQLCKDGVALEFIRDAFRHGKTLMAIGSGVTALQRADIPTSNPKDTGVIVTKAATKTSLSTFIAAVEMHRHPQRETDPPRI